MSATRVTSIRRCRRLLVLSALSVGLAVPAAPASATNCSTNSIGNTNSRGVAGATAQTTACAPAYGQPTTNDTGRKVG